MRFIIAALCLFSFGTVCAQNSPFYFKRLPYPGEIPPPWAAKMYSPDANVFEVETLRAEWYATHPYEKDIHERNYAHWTRAINELVQTDGSIGAKPNYPLQNNPEVRMAGSGWECAGPKETYNLGSEGGFPVSWQANVYCMDQSATNPDILVAGTEAGDLFKSTNRGLNWFPISEGLNARTITAASIAPSNPNHIWFFPTNVKILYRSTDGGGSWVNKLTLPSTADEITIHPTNPNIVLVSYGNGLQRTTDGGTTWTQLQTERCFDADFHPSNPNIVYLLRKNTPAKSLEFLRSTNAGATWALQTNGWYVPFDPFNAIAEGGRIAVTPAAPNRVYVSLLGQSKAGDNGWIGLYVSSNTGLNWNNPAGQDGGPYNGTSIQNPASLGTDGSGFNQGYYNHGLAVSSIDSNRVWVGCLALNRSSNGGQSWDRIGGYNATTYNLGWVHPDVQDICVRGNDIWVASDGGINYSNTELSSHESRKNGITGSDYWGYGQGWNHDIMVGGRYHNGNSGYFQTYGTGNTLRLGGGESPTGHVNPLIERKAYFDDISDRILPSTLTGGQIGTSNMQVYPRGSYSDFESSELVFHPLYAGTLFLGRDSTLFKSTDEGRSFSALHHFPGSGIVYEIEVAPSNPSVIYCTYRPGSNFYTWTTLQKSTDGGNTWTQLPNPPGSSLRRMLISVNPANENEIWGISAGQAIAFRSTNGGATWQSLSTSVIAGQSLRDIAFQGGANTAWIASATDAFYYDPNIPDWVNYRAGLPLNIPTLTLEPFYRDGKMRLSTNGKGIWERDFATPSLPVAIPMTLTPQVTCSRDTVELGCHSVLNHAGATWLWNITPAPLYISSTNSPTIKVVFGNSGSYSVGLTVTDALANSSSRTVPNMITVTNGCDPDTIPGMAMRTTNIGDYATSAPIGITTANYTVTAWVKPNGIQPDYTGIVISDADVAGFNFRGGNNTLGYHWPGGQWYWNSGLVVPQNEWSYVALVITPNSATVYVNGIAATQNIAIQPANIGTLFMGSYLGWTSRNFKGELDEVKIWNRSLTQN